MMKPKRLQKGDTVGIIAPSGIPQPEKLEKGLIFLNELGLKLKLGRHVYDKYGYLAGTDIDRLEDLHTMFEDPEVKAIFCARGGYGAARLAPMINYSLIQNNPKILWGYSDITFLHLAIGKHTGLVTFHGPMLASDFGNEFVEEQTKQSITQLFDSNPVNISSNNEQSVIDGYAFGPLIGGNLTLLTSSLGTKFELDTTGKVLLIEEIKEQPRAVDRMLNQLYMAGKLTDCSGILIGDFHECTADSGPSFSTEEVILHYLRLANKPAMKGFKVGHCSPNLAVPLGVNAMIDTRKQEVLIESGVL
ncbi:S66 peptidase family protein [Mesobacillus maritimus]|uniref:S66 peptidase family protein n=1 Tax=Mesobacillus maritimus TaxID=1643336 RepID=UPI00255A01F2|nr:LD-carboxypeptidase [Mesobacillus maritimus]